MHCEICGREISWGYLVEIEGAKLVACADCAERGVIIRKVWSRTEPRKRRIGEASDAEEKEVVLVEDYGRRIREARERAGLTVEELAKKLHVREGYLHKVEESELTPTDDLARRLEKILHITLFEEISEDDAELAITEEGVGTGLTLGDVVKLTWRRKK